MHSFNPEFILRKAENVTAKIKRLAFKKSIYPPCFCLLIYHRDFCSTLPPQINREHHPSPMSSELGFLPAMYSFPGFINVPEMGINIGSANTFQHLPGVSPPSTSWERRCLRKHRRRADDEGCSAKKRRLMGEAGCDPLDDLSPNVCQIWPPGNNCSPLPESASQAPPQHCLGTQNLELPISGSPSHLASPEAEGSCIEVATAHRRLQEIEERITLEDDDDDDDEDLDVEPAPRRPVLVMSDSLREGLQRGISDILPHTVAQSVSHSCMELVVWRLPEDALARKLKDSLQRKQQTTSRQPPTPSATPTPQIPPTPTNPPGETYSPLYCSPGAGAHSSGEEDMEL
ncbi:coiled-coil domain-containing protein 117-like isoform X2 [Coregonus clupeaformis]|uniref:coiled-coil domain-containing protein 117-like isoform X2 n=1 Tax=Coregonus clupeaformis TaxID=59861 RepID=UPI001BDF88CE|nr:coiled-coil domain-containing protein 117-like isoform X2 [Coregonus clupeaformis]